jgi:hypothetical protein
VADDQLAVVIGEPVAARVAEAESGGIGGGLPSVVIEREQHRAGLDMAAVRPATRKGRELEDGMAAQKAPLARTAIRVVGLEDRLQGFGRRARHEDRGESLPAAGPLGGFDLGAVVVVQLGLAQPGQARDHVGREQACGGDGEHARVEHARMMPVHADMRLSGRWARLRSAPRQTVRPVPSRSGSRPCRDHRHHVEGDIGIGPSRCTIWRALLRLLRHKAVRSPPLRPPLVVLVRVL